MRHARRTATAFLIALCLLITACPKSQTLASYSHQVVSEIDVAVPILRSNGVDTAILLKVRGLAAKAEIAFNNADNEEGAALVGELIDVFEGELMEQIARIPSATIRTIAMVGLYAVNRKLHSLSDRLETEAKALPPASVARARRGVRGKSPVATVESFNKKKQWRCRDSKTGRFVKMDQCKASPATTQVDTF